MNVKELISCFPTVDAIDWYFKKEGDFVRHHTTYIFGGLPSEYDEVTVLKADIGGVAKLNLYVDKCWEG